MVLGMGREWAVSTELLERVVTAERRGDALELTIDGRACAVRAAKIKPGLWSLLIEGRSHLIALEGSGAERVAVVGGRRIAVHVEDAQQKRLAAAVGAGTSAAAGEIIRTPIAGRVVKVLVAEGDEVAAGAGVIVLEAMKMENELRAERGGVVTRIHTEAGRPVDTGEVLVTLE